jgi:glycosyltransferase involved in cell wall biosynthesis
MLVSIVINTKNEEKNIRNCLEAVRGQSYPQDEIEIIVVDNNSTDKTREIAREYTKEVFVRGPERSVQKNFGVENSKGECFIHLDADMVLGKKVIEECVEIISKDEGLIALYIPEVVVGKSFFARARNFERGFYDGTVIDAVRFIRKGRFLEAGKFDEKLYACEDWDLDKRLKKLGKFEIIKSPLYHNEEEFSLKEYLSKKKYYSKNFDVYIEKWGKNDPDIKKQFGFYYRFLRVFVENGKWKKLVRYPILAIGMYFLRVLVGVKYLLK